MYPGQSVALQKPLKNRMNKWIIAVFGMRINLDQPFRFRTLNP